MESVTDTESRVEENRVRALIKTIVPVLSLMALNELKGLLKLIDGLLNLPPLRRALLLKVLDPEISNRRLAAMVGIDRGTLADDPAFQRIKQAVRVLPHLDPGHVDDQGFIESYLTPDN